MYASPFQLSSALKAFTISGRTHLLGDNRSSLVFATIKTDSGERKKQHS